MLAKLKYKTTRASDLKNEIAKKINSNNKLKLDYVEIVSTRDLKPILNDDKSKSAVICIAVFLGNIRLIDNMMLN